MEYQGNYFGWTTNYCICKWRKGYGLYRRAANPTAQI